MTDLVSLLYRADWTRLSLAAEVSTRRDLDLDRSQDDDRRRERPGSGRVWEMATDTLGTETDRSTLLILPGGRYREQGHGYLGGCDGNRSWRATENSDRWTVDETGGPEPPMPPMLRPSWLLSGFVLEAGGPVTADGRDALRVVATPRPEYLRRRLGARPPDRVEIIVDAGLGILLRHEEVLDGRTLRLTELTSIRAATVPDGDAWCRPPGGWDSVGDDVPRTTPAGPGFEAAKLVADMAATGFGSLIRSSLSRSFEQATREEAEAEMPVSDGPPPGDGPAVSDEVLHLLHASPDRWAPGVTATLHEWHDVAAMLAQVPDTARSVGFGGLGYLIDAAGERIATVHMVSRISFGGPGQYRIEPVPGPGQRQLATLVCDGERRWRIDEDEVATGFAGPPPGHIANLLDASWLLAHRLTGGAEVVADGRSGYRLGVTAEDSFRAGLSSADSVVVDAELGILLCSVSRAGSRPVSRYELRDVVLGEPGDFRPDIPAGVRVVEELDDEPPGPASTPAQVATLLARQAARDARSAFKNVFGGPRR